jgi:hypothetical protein
MGTTGHVKGEGRIMGRENSHITFEPGPDSPSGKTKTWRIKNKDTDEVIGEIRWAGNFRKYAFYPYPHTMYDNACLADIAYALVLRTEQHREMLAR